MVWSHVAVTVAGAFSVPTLIELPVKSRSPAVEQLCTTPCSLATLPVLAVCWSVGLRFTLLPALEMTVDGEAPRL